MSSKILEPYDEEARETPPPWVPPRDIRDLFSYRLALLTRINDRSGQTMLMKNYKMTIGEWRTLAVVCYLGKPSLRAVARETQQDEGQLSRYVSGLIKRGLLMKTVSPDDRRSVHLSLTPAAEELYGPIMDSAWKAHGPMFATLTRKEQEQFIRLFDKVFANVLRE